MSAETECARTTEIPVFGLDYVAEADKIYCFVEINCGEDVTVGSGMVPVVPSEGETQPGQSAQTP